MNKHIEKIGYGILPIIDLHPCLQGEGKFTGVPHILIRTSKCNLRCQFKDSLCDTPFASYNPERGQFSISDIRILIETHPRIEKMMITGGEPSIHTELLSALIELGNGVYFMGITIETNGTGRIIIPDGSKVELVSISPKLSNSIPNKLGDEWMLKHSRLRLNYPNFERLMSEPGVEDFQFKFVVNQVDINGRTPILDEIDEIIHKLGIPDNRIYLMPEGDTRELLDMNRLPVYEHALRMGWNFSDRLQIVTYGRKRGV